MKPVEYRGMSDEQLGLSLKEVTKNLFHLYSMSGVVHLMDAMYDATYVPPDMSVARLLRIFKRPRCSSKLCEKALRHESSNFETTRLQMLQPSRCQLCGR